MIHESSSSLASAFRSLFLSTEKNLVSLKMIRNVAGVSKTTYSLADVEADLSSIVSEIEKTYLSVKDLYLQVFPPEIKGVEKEAKPEHEAGRGMPV